MSVGIVLGSVVLLLMGGLCVALIVDNTKVLNEEKALRRELADIQREADSIGPAPTDVQVAALNARLNAFRLRFEAWQRSPFVITRSGVC